MKIEDIEKQIECCNSNLVSLKNELSKARKEENDKEFSNLPAYFRQVWKDGVKDCNHRWLIRIDSKLDGEECNDRGFYCRTTNISISDNQVILEKRMETLSTKARDYRLEIITKQEFDEAISSLEIIMHIGKGSY